MILVIADMPSTVLDHPTPDFTVRHMCRRYDEVTGWFAQHGLLYPTITKPNDPTLKQLSHYP